MSKTFEVTFKFFYEADDNTLAEDDQHYIQNNPTEVLQKLLRRNKPIILIRECLNPNRIEEMSKSTKTDYFEFLDELLEDDLNQRETIDQLKAGFGLSKKVAKQIYKEWQNRNNEEKEETQ